MKVFVFLGGPLEQWPTEILQQVKDARLNTGQKLIGVDYGNINLIRNGIIPDVAVGDYDSLSVSELHEVQTIVGDVRYAKPEKDFTDSEMGISVALEDFLADEVILIGATGGRIDHFLVNLFSILNGKLQKSAMKVKIIDRQNIISFYLPGTWQVKRISSYKYLAFINLTAIEHFNISDAKYPLTDFSSSVPVSWASNEFVGESVSFAFTKGVVAVVYSRD